MPGLFIGTAFDVVRFYVLRQRFFEEKYRSRRFGGTKALAEASSEKAFLEKAKGHYVKLPI